MPRPIPASDLSGKETKGMLLALPEPPSANRWWRNVSGRMVLSQAAKEYKADVYAHVLSSLAVRRIPWLDKETTCRVDVDWYRGRKSGDLDKRLGVLLDALQGTAYASDSQIVEIVARRFNNPRHPCVIVRVRPFVQLDAPLDSLLSGNHLVQWNSHE